MNNLENLLFFLFFFSLLSTIRLITKFLVSLFAKEIKPFFMTDRELLFYSITLSYLITYIFKIT